MPEVFANTTPLQYFHRLGRRLARGAGAGLESGHECHDYDSG